jgi:cob(I)alamin adenosyltransferase
LKLYTKTGDKGTTSIIGGTRLPKSDARIAAYGTLDEANSWLGVVISELTATAQFPSLKNQLQKLQVLLFDCGTDFASLDGTRAYLVTEKEVQTIEQWIDFYSAEVPPLKQFILPGGQVVASHLQVIRTVIRRAERELAELLVANIKINDQAYQVINRLSDLFFAMARFVNVQTGTPEPAYDTTFKNLEK